MEDIRAQLLAKNAVHADRPPLSHSALLMAVTNAQTKLKLRSDKHGDWNNEAQKEIARALGLHPLKRARKNLNLDAPMALESGSSAPVAIEDKKSDEKSEKEGDEKGGGMAIEDEPPSQEKSNEKSEKEGDEKGDRKSNEESDEESDGKSSEESDKKSDAKSGGKSDGKGGKKSDEGNTNTDMNIHKH